MCMVLHTPKCRWCAFIGRQGHVYTFKSPIVSEVGYLFSDSKELSELVTFSDTKEGLLSTMAILYQRMFADSAARKLVGKLPPIFVFWRENTKVGTGRRSFGARTSRRDMRLNCELEVVYSLALANGGTPSRSSRARASICLGKKVVPSQSSSSASSEGSAKKEELFLIVSTAKNVAGNKYKVRKT